MSSSYIVNNSHTLLLLRNKTLFTSLSNGAFLVLYVLQYSARKAKESYLHCILEQTGDRINFIHIHVNFIKDIVLSGYKTTHNFQISIITWHCIIVLLFTVIVWIKKGNLDNVLLDWRVEASNWNIKLSDDINNEVLS